jgi:predicted nucleotide-binding protein
MKLEEVKRLLIQAGHEINSESRLGNDTGTQLKIDCGAVVNVFDKGTWSVQGKETAKIKAILEKVSSSEMGKTSPANVNVFIVYGHNADLRNQLEAMLRRWALKPIFIDQLPSEGQTIIEKLENCTKSVNFGIVLATADDEGYRVGHADEKAFRVRQNVVLELGMLLALLDRSRVAILMQQTEKMERPSDIEGLIYIPFRDNIAKDAGPTLAREMAAQGYIIDVKNL